MCWKRPPSTARPSGCSTGPNPAGRPIEGLTLREGWESFVGAGPIPMRHGLTLGELGIWFVSHFHLAVDYRVIPMRGWKPEEGAGFRLADRRTQLGESEPERGESRRWRAPTRAR